MSERCDLHDKLADEVRSTHAMVKEIHTCVLGKTEDPTSQGLKGIALQSRDKIDSHLAASGRFVWLVIGAVITTLVGAVFTAYASGILK